jgi:toxin ParE1/3/4
MKLIIKSAAKKDLRNIATYIGKDNPKRAVSFVAEINQKIRLLTERPFSFPAHEEWQQSVRSALHGQYHIIFEVTGNEIVVLRVLHGARNIADII